MFFRPIIEDLEISTLAAEIGLPAKNVRSWIASDSIPAGHFNDIVRVAKRKGRPDITVKKLVDLAERRRRARDEGEGAAQ